MVVDPSDAALLRRAQLGDQAAFRTIVERYQHRLYAVAYGVLHNREDALDAVQETFIKMHRSLESFKSESALFTWLYRICMNSAIDLQRKRVRRPTVEFDELLNQGADAVGADVAPQAANPARELSNKELGALIEQAIAELPEAQRQVIVLREIEQLSYQEIAEVCECSNGTVMSRLHYGRKRLQQILAPYL